MDFISPAEVADTFVANGALKSRLSMLWMRSSKRAKAAVPVVESAPSPQPAIADA